MLIIWIGVGGAIGSILRCAFGFAMGASRFPWATLGVNLIGSLLLGFVLIWPTVVGRWKWRVPITVGILGGMSWYQWVVDWPRP